MYELSEETLLRPGDLTTSDRRALVEARQRSAWFPFLRGGASPRAAAWVCAVAEHGMDWGVRDAKGRVTQRNELGLMGSIVSVSKVFDALTSRRSYRAAITPAAALGALTRDVGYRFRPDVLQLFVRFAKRQSVRIQPRR